MENINKFVHVLKQEIIKNVTTNFHKLKIYVQEIVIKNWHMRPIMIWPNITTVDMLYFRTYRH